MTIYEIIRDVCDNYGYKYRNDYRGRGMYDRTCVGFVTSPHDTVGAIMDVVRQSLAEVDFENEPDSAQNFINYTLDILCDARTDSMGLNSIVYFPSLKSDPDYEEEYD